MNIRVDGGGRVGTGLGIGVGADWPPQATSSPTPMSTMVSQRMGRMVGTSLVDGKGGIALGIRPWDLKSSGGGVASRLATASSLGATINATLTSFS